MEKLNDDSRKHNVKAHGAVGDGIADDTVAIQAAIDMVVPVGSGYVYFTNGTYNLYSK